MNYRMLIKNEAIHDNDEALISGRWIKVDKFWIGFKLAPHAVGNFRRPVKSKRQTRAANGSLFNGR